MKEEDQPQMTVSLKVDQDTKMGIVCLLYTSRKHQANVKTARLYISHFIQVLNLAVIRSEVRIAHKEYYGLDTSNNSCV